MTERTVPDRFLDAAEEPDQTLLPILDYDKVPLVSIGEATQPIKSLLYEADAMIETAKRNSRKPTDCLTSDESAAIHLYTMQWPSPHSSLYKLLNENLRSQDRNSLIPWFHFLKLFLTALHKLPSYKGVIWRGVSGNLTEQYDDDQIWWGTSSCTESMQIMETFIGRHGPRTIFNIECINGKSIRAHSYFKKENEILLLPGSYFKVVSKWSPATDLYIIQLREQSPPYQTIVNPSHLSPSENILVTRETVAGQCYQTWLPVLTYLQLGPTDLEPTYNFDYSTPGVSETKMIGGYQCYLPIGWYRHALKVTDKYPGHHRWLASKNVIGEWPIAYHGTCASAIKNIVDKGLLIEFIKMDAQRSEAVNQMGNIADRPGLYVTTHCDEGASLYTQPFFVRTSSNKISHFHVVIQCRVRPHSFTTHLSPVATGECWRIVDPQAIRPVAILLKKQAENVSFEE